jgi:AcrR family transcriptional regulator
MPHPRRPSASRPPADRAPGAPAAPSPTAARILAAADELFCRHGYAAVSARDVARAARVPKAAVFYHFGDKPSLFEKVLETYYHAHREALAAAFAGGGTLGERLHRVIDAYVDFIAGNLRYATLIQQQVGSPETHPLIERNLAPLLRWMEEALAPLTPAHGPLAARHFFVTFSGIVINYFTYAPLLAAGWAGDPLAPAAVDERRRHVQWIVDTLLGGLAAASAAAPAPAAQRRAASPGAAERGDVRARPQAEAERRVQRERGTVGGAGVQVSPGARARVPVGDRRAILGG